MYFNVFTSAYTSFKYIYYLQVANQIWTLELSKELLRKRKIRTSPLGTFLFKEETYVVVFTLDTRVLF